jgi:hypothetical protein
LTVVGFLAPASLDTYPLYLAAFRRPKQTRFCRSAERCNRISLGRGQYGRFPELAAGLVANELVDRYRAGNERSCERLWDMFRLPDFSVVVLLRRTDEFAALKAELLGAAVTEPYESTE